MMICLTQLEYESGELILLGRRRPAALSPAQLFDSEGRFRPPISQTDAGNSVRIGNGCATVTGYRPPRATGTQVHGKAGARFEARSQDNGPFVLVSRGSDVADFSAKEKDEAGPANRFRR